MTILYEGVGGSGPCMWLSIAIWSIAGLAGICAIVLSFTEKDTSYLLFLILAIAVALVGFRFTSDDRYTEVYATIDDSVSWTEVNEKYELIKQKGEMYIFKEREKDETQEGL